MTYEEDEERTDLRPSSSQTSRFRAARVEVVQGPDAGLALTLDGREPVGVGTSADNVIVLSDRHVSRYHLELRPEAFGVRIVDLGSTNGTEIAQLRIESALASPPVSIRIGSTTLRLLDRPIAEHETGEASRVAAIAGLVGQSRAMAAVASAIERLGNTSLPVLVTGETGVGKELVARALHDRRGRPRAPFEIVDCGAVAPTLIASQLFGHERGAFTGAESRGIGAFERAHGGTLFLDEIGELPLAVQASLLGVLERKRFRRVGGAEELEVDVRVVSATHRDLRGEVNTGAFRADLYFRLAAARIAVPPLRERPEDIPALVEHFARQATGQALPDQFDGEVMASLAKHRWSGNVRELKNVVETTLALGELSLEGETAGLDARGSTVLQPYRVARADALERFEREYLEQLWAASGGNVTQAARNGEMDRKYLVELLRKHGLRER